MSKGWDSVALKKLKALTGKGLSTSEIGKRLGMSKNAIVGKLNRLGWNAKAGGIATVKEAEVKTGSKKTTDKKTVAEIKKSKAKDSTKKTKTSVKNSNAEKSVTKKKETATVGKTAKVAEEKKTKSESKMSAKSLAVHQRIVQHSLEMANLKPNQCRWPIGDPDSEHFHFCGETVFVGKPYCYEHCKQAYQFTPPKKK